MGISCPLTKTTKADDTAKQINVLFLAFDRKIAYTSFDVLPQFMHKIEQLEISDKISDNVQQFDAF